MSTQILADSHEELRERWQQAKAAYPHVALSAHQALRAINNEEKAEHTLASIVPTDAFEAYKFCEALASLALALEAWAYISARLWYLCENGQADEEIKALHHNSAKQYQRILAAHLQTQEQAFAFCQQHQIILRFGVITQLLDVSVQACDDNTKTCVSERTEIHA